MLAWLHDDGCENTYCHDAIEAGRRVHISPAPQDPRAAEFSLVLPTYHYATADEAIAALEAAWQDAEVATNKFVSLRVTGLSSSV